MDSKLFIGNLDWVKTTDESLRNHFSAAGTVTDAVVIKDRMTGKSRGFGFVTFSNGDEAKKAIEMFNGKDLDGRAITVNVAQARQ